MKEWPDNDEYADFDDLMEPLKEIMLIGYDLKRREQTNDYKYSGYRTFGFTVQPDKIFTKEVLGDTFREQGRTLLDAVLQVVFNLGMEQGKRDYKQRRIKDGMTIDFLENALKQLKHNQQLV